MLSQLTIQNFGLIERLSLEFSQRLNILTGETGAGKSILIDALRILLGERLASSQIRNPSLPCVVEGVFVLDQKELLKHPLLSEYLRGENELILNRTYSQDGRNKIKVNGFFITVNELKEIGNLLVDFHGPHDHQLLFSDQYHIGMLDQLTVFEELKKEYDGIFKEFAAYKNDLAALDEAKQTRERDWDLLQHQVSELEQLPLNQDHYEELLQEQIRSNNAEKLYESVHEALDLLDNEDHGINEQIRRLFFPLRSLNQTDAQTEPLSELLNQVQNNVQDLISEINDYAERLSFDPQKIKQINDQCDIYDNIRRKYGPTLEAANGFYLEAKKRLELLKNWEENDQKIREELKTREKKLKTIAQKMTERRKKTALSLKKTIEKELSELGIVHVQFECRVEPIELNPLGQDKATFYISPNAGEALKPLSQIVSSGEAARLMLALKKALIKVDPIPVLIFDEIDAQIGGRLGTITGNKLKEISQNRQVILITHLPQIASFGDFHYKVTKIVKDGRALTHVELLEEDSRLKEIAKMMSGEKETKISLTHAEEMLSKARHPD